MAIDEQRYQHSMNKALDHELPEQELEALQAHISASEETANAWEHLQKTDRLLHETPLSAPSPGFTSRVMAAIAAMPIPEFMSRPLSLGLVLGLVAAAFLSLPLLSVLLILLVTTLTDPGAMNTVFQAVIDGAGYLIGLEADLGRELHDIVSNTPLVLLLIGAVIPVTLVWGWLIRRFLGGPRLLTNREKSR